MSKLGALVLIFIGSLYFFCAPSTVQTLDSGEIVTNAYGLFVMHPPGYPLMTWLGYLVTHVPLGTVFLRASVFAIVCALVVLALIPSIAKHDTQGSARGSLLSSVLVLGLGFTPVFWKYAVTPDVFMLHLLFCAALVFVYLGFPASSGRLWALSLLFGLASAHHHTILFCLPLVLHAAIELKSMKKALLPLITGAALTLLLYASLLLLNTDSLHSWGKLKTLSDVTHHFLRREFGTFQLSGHAESSFSIEAIAKFIREFVTTNPFTLLILALGWAFTVKASKLERRTLVLCFSTLLSFACLIPFATGVDHSVVERFYLMPFTMCTLLAASLSGAIKLQKQENLVLTLVGVGALVVSFSNALAASSELNLSKDTVVEDYAQNLLRMTDGRSKSILMIGGDTTLFALRYVQVSQGLSPETILLPLGMIFDRTRIQKIQSKYPDFKVSAEWDEGPNSRSVVDHMIKPNLGAFDLVTTFRVQFTGMKTIFLGLGRRLVPGEGSDIDRESLKLIQRRSEISSEPSLNFDEKRALYSEYAFPYLKMGLNSQTQDESLQHFKDALAAVPYCFPAQENLCALLEKKTGHPDSACLARFAELKETERNYY